MKKIPIGVLLLLFLSFGIATVSAQPVLRDDYPERYTVIKGDTLWDISNKFLQNPWMWPEIWQVNPQIDNPHLIFPGDVITLIYLDGRPRLTVQRGESVASTGGRPGDIKLSPRVHVTPIDEAVPSIPLDMIDSFLSESRIVGLSDLEGAPYALAGGENRLIVGAGDVLYARGAFSEQTPTYGVYRRGQIYVDPDTNEVLGVEAQDIGAVRIRALERDIATTVVTRTNEEIRIGDRLMAQEERAIDSNFWPSPPGTAVEGKILAVEGGLSKVGKFDVVVINRGAREGISVGNVLAVYKASQLARDRIANGVVRLPEEKAGLMMVFRTFEKLSLGLVMESEFPISTLDVVRNP
jgi:nucleoid-associated protein YgaU